jgi:hypothetical protein
MDEGWIVVARKANDHPCLQAFDARGVWDKLLLLAKFRPCRALAGGHEIELLRGQLAVSIRGLAEAGGISHKRIRTIMEIFARSGMVKTVPAKGKALSIVTICNYDVYQGADDTEGTAQGTVGAQVGHSRGTLLRRKKEQGTRNKRESPNGDIPPKPDGYGSEFEALWKTYPTRKEDDKAGCHRLWKVAVRTSDVAAVLTSAREWCAEQSANPYCIGLRRWLKDKRYLHPPPVYRPGDGEHSDPIGDSERQFLEITRKMNGHGHEEFTGTRCSLPVGPPPDIWNYPEDEHGADDLADSTLRRSIRGYFAGSA